MSCARLEVGKSHGAVDELDAPAGIGRSEFEPQPDLAGALRGGANDSSALKHLALDHFWSWPRAATEAARDVSLGRKREDAVYVLGSRQFAAAVPGGERRDGRLNEQRRPDLVVVSIGGSVVGDLVDAGTTGFSRTGEPSTALHPRCASACRSRSAPSSTRCGPAESQIATDMSLASNGIHRSLPVSGLLLATSRRKAATSASDGDTASTSTARPCVPGSRLRSRVLILPSRKCRRCSAICRPAMASSSATPDDTRPAL